MKPLAAFARSAALALAAVLASGPARAQDAAEFYRGKTITFLVGAPESGSYVAYAQLISEHLRRHIPGQPTIIVKTLSGQGGSIATANQMQNTVARDGLTLAMTQPGIVMAQVINPEFARFDARTWSWVGNMASVRNMLAVWHTARAQTIEAAKVHEVVAAATGPNSATYIIPNFLNKHAGTRFRIVTGYRGSADMTLAIQRGEADVRGGSWESIELASPHLIAEGKVRPMVFAALTRDPNWPAVPLLMELVKDPAPVQAARFMSAESAFGKAVFLPPGVPAERVQLMRRAFEATLKDPAFIEDARRRKAPIEPTDWETMTRVAREVIEAPGAIVEMAK